MTSSLAAGHDIWQRHPTRATCHANPVLLGEVLAEEVERLARDGGNPHIRALLAASGATLAICGHDHWHRPLADIDIAGRSPLQVLDVDSRAVLLTTARA